VVHVADLAWGGTDEFRKIMTKVGTLVTVGSTEDSKSVYTGLQLELSKWEDKPCVTA
jgi:hypothetical protein